MELIKINQDERLYVIASGSGFSCYGFDVLDRKARAILQWIGQHIELPAPGTAAHFAACDKALQDGAAYAARTGKRCNAELVPALIGLEGARVECTMYGERVRFNVGKSTGWMPCHLELKNSRSSGGCPLHADSMRDVRVIRR